MNTTIELIKLLENRQNLYNFLAHIYKIEVDTALLNNIKQVEFPNNSPNLLINQGYKMIEDYINTPREDSLTELAVDYARVFLAAGMVGKNKAAYPYESVYTSEKRIIMQEARDEVVEFYNRNNLAVAEEIKLPEDHIALEFEFMAYLCDTTIEQIKEGNLDKANKILKEQAEFLELHLQNWIPEFCDDINKFSSTLFYKGISKVTSGFLEFDKLILQDLLATPTSQSIVNA